MQTTKWLLPGLALALVIAQVAVAAPPINRGDAGGHYGVLVPDLAQTIDVNEISMFVTNQGSWGYDQLIGDAGLEWPIGSGRTAVFAAGLWLGAKVNGEVRVTVGEFSQEYAAGPMNDSGQAVDPLESDPQWKVLKIGTGDDASNPDWLEWQRLGELLGDDGPPLDENGDPELLGNQSTWCVYNDAVAEKHTNDAGSSTPMGVEVRQTAFAFNLTGALGKTVFLDFEIENKGSNVLEEMYISLWFDPDLGGFTDDLVGSDVDLSLGFCYNATNTDAQYTSFPPAMGCDFFLGPIVGGDTLGMASFNKYINGTDPQSPSETYNYMQGLEANGDPQFCLGDTTTFVLSGDPTTGEGCLDTDPADRRFMMSTGPITMNPGEEQRVVAAIIIGGEPGKGDRLSNVSLLKFYDLSAQDAFDRDFQVPAPPPPPQVSVTELDGEIILSWDQTSQREYDEPGYVFEGYNIYQGETANGPYTLIDTYDDVNGLAIIKDDRFNPTKGAIENVVVQQGKDSGIGHEIALTRDFVRGGQMRNGMIYHFAVTAYAYNATAVPGQLTLENRIETVTVVPQNVVSGVDLSTAAIEDVTYTAVSDTLPPASNALAVTVIDPTRVTGHDYRVEFYPVTPRTEVIDGVSVPVDHEWRVIDTVTDATVLDEQYNLSGNSDFPSFDGIKVQMTGVYFPQMQGAAYNNNDDTNRRALSWVNWGGRFFGGAVDTGCRWAGSTIVGEEEEALDPDTFGCSTVWQPDLFATVELRFNATQKGYRYHRHQIGADNAGAPAGGRAYTYEGYDDLICTVWKIVGDTETQLQVMYTERSYNDDSGNPLPTQPASQDAVWNPTSEGDGGREYLQILDVPYSDTPDPTYTQEGIFFAGTSPLLFGTWFRQRADGDVIDPDDTFEFTWGNPADANDLWNIATASAVGVSSGVIVGDDNLAKSRDDLSLVRAVPNPYFTRSAYELDQFNRIMKFVNLPAVCKVRVFTLAGDLVRTIDKDDATTSIVEWDLETEFGLPVGSGVYVFHVEAPGIGNTFGKLAVFMEKERLEDF